MKKLSLMLCVLCLVTCPLASAQNLAPNPGMEEVAKVTDKIGNKLTIPASWTSQTLPHCVVTEEPANVHAGKRALQLPTDAVLNKKLPVIYGDRFRVSFWAKGEGRLRAITFEYDKDNPPIPFWHVRQGAWELSDEWQQCSFEYTPKALLTERQSRVPTDFILNLELRRPGRIAYIDDIVIEKTKEGDGKLPEGKTYWLPERITDLSDAEAQEADLVARSDYVIPGHFKPTKVFGKEFRFHLYSDWFHIPWLAEEPFVKHAMIMEGLDARIDLVFREMEVFGPGDPEKNLALVEGRDVSGDAVVSCETYPYRPIWYVPEGLADGNVPDPDGVGWWGGVRNLGPEHGVCAVADWGIPPDAHIGIAFPEVVTVDRVVLHHGRPWNVTFLDQFVWMSGVASDFELEATEDGKVWKPIPGTRVEGNRREKSDITFKPVRARGIRVHAWNVAPLYEVKNGNGWKRIYWGLREYALRENKDVLRSREVYARDTLSSHPWGIWLLMGNYITPLSPRREEILEAHKEYWGPALRDLKKQTKGMQYGGALYEWDHYTRKGAGRELVPYWRGEGLEPYTPAAWRSFWARQADSGSRTLGGPSWLVASGSRPWVHWEALEDDNLGVATEFKGGYTTAHFQLNLVNLRSAGRQYGKPWGVYSQPRLGLNRQPGKSEFSTLRRKGGAGYDIGDGWYIGPEQGVSASAWKRRIWGNYFAGETIQDFEFFSGAVVHWPESGTQVPANVSGMLAGQGKAMRDLGRLDEKIGSRGATYTPVALLLDYNAGWRPHGFRWQARLYHEGDDQVNELFLTFFPVAGRSLWGIGYEVANKDIANTPFGEIVDILKPNLPSGIVPQEQLDAYKVLWMAGGWTPVEGPTGAPIDDPRISQRLTKYVQNGGTLVLNAAYLKGVAPAEASLNLPPSFLGITLTGERKCASEARFALDDTKKRPVLKSDPFLYWAMQPAEGTRILARTPDGDALMTLTKAGKGHVIVSGIEHNLTDVSRRLVPAAERLLRYLSERITPFIVEGRCRWIATGRKNGWFLMLANNEGVFKDPQEDPEVDHLARKTLKITFEGEVKAVDEVTQDYKWPFKTEDGKTTCSITVPAGGIRVLFFRK